MKNMEIECKLDANTAHAFAIAKRVIKEISPVAVPRVLHIQDVYFDHAKKDLAARKIALRIRNTDGKWEATFKTRTVLKHGRAVRREETLPLPNSRHITQAAAYLAQRKIWKGIAVRQLIPQFKILNKRTVFVFNYDGAELEMALDAITICAAGRQLKMKEIEVELKRGAQRKLDLFMKLLQQKTKLKTAKISKVKTAELFLNMFKK